MPQFVQRYELGTIKVPNDYSFASWWGYFCRNFSSEFKDFDRALFDKDGAPPSYQLAPNEEVAVKLYEQTDTSERYSDERYKFLKETRSIFPGINGFSMVFAQLREQLPAGRQICLIEDRKHLLVHGKNHVVPIIKVKSEKYDACLLGGCHEYTWPHDYLSIGFYPVK